MEEGVDSAFLLESMTKVLQAVLIVESSAT
jgi:hypothetical protein